VHLDLVVADLDAMTAEVDALGGWRLDPAIMHDLAGFQLSGSCPEGNEFDIDVLSPE
jgi:hypothetical protein